METTNSQNACTENVNGQRITARKSIPKFQKAFEKENFTSPKQGFPDLSSTLTTGSIIAQYPVNAWVSECALAHPLDLLVKFILGLAAENTHLAEDYQQDRLENY